MTFLDCVSVTSWALVYAVISFEVHSLILGVGIFSVNVFTLAMNESSRSLVHSKGTSFCSKCLKGAITGVLQKQKATWFINPYQDLTSEMQLGDGNSKIESLYLGEGLMPSLGSRNPANSTVSLANLNF